MMVYYFFIGVILAGFIFVIFCLLRMASIEERRMEREKKSDLFD